MIYSNSKEDYNSCFITQLMLNHSYARYIGTILATCLSHDWLQYW